MEIIENILREVAELCLPAWKGLACQRGSFLMHKLVFTPNETKPRSFWNWKRSHLWAESCLRKVLLMLADLAWGMIARVNPFSQYPVLFFSPLGVCICHRFVP